MKLWRKSKKTDRELPSFVKIGLVKFNQKLIDIANSLQQKTNEYSVTKKKVLLGVFVVVFVTECLIVTIQGVKGDSKTSVEVSRIKALPIQNQGRSIPAITKSEFLRIQRFKNYADSLNTTRAGRKARDSLLRNRPHLMDSVNFLVNLYLEQIKNKMK